MTAPSLWLREVEAQLPRWPEAQSEPCDVLVVGGGLSGLSVARALTAAGRAVRVLDRTAPGGGASGRNAGYVLATHVTSYPTMRRHLGADLSRRMLRLAQQNHALIRERFGRLAELRDVGSLMLGVAGDAEEAAVLEDARALLIEDGVPAERVAVPAGLSGFDVALAIPEDGDIHPGRLILALTADLEGRRGTVSSIDRARHEVTLENGARLTYRTLVIATNAWTTDLLPEVSVSPQRAQMLCTAPVAPFLTRPCYAGFGYEYFRQRPDGRVLLGGRRALFLESEATAQPDPSAPVQAALDAYLREHLPAAAAAPVEMRWAGTMGFSADELPLIGAVSADVHVIGGFTGHGLGTALAGAELLARAITGAAGPDDRALLDALAPTRRAATLGAPK